MTFRHLLVTFAFVSGCATGYQESSVTGGYSHEELGPDHFRVRYEGNYAVGPQEAVTYWHRRCAELCEGREYEVVWLEKGHPFFIHLVASPGRLVEGRIRCKE